VQQDAQLQHGTVDLLSVSTDSLALSEQIKCESVKQQHEHLMWVQILNLGLETDYPKIVSGGLSFVPSGKCRDHHYHHHHDHHHNHHHDHHHHHHHHLKVLMFSGRPILYRAIFLPFLGHALVSLK
jgi:hypothetical protein